MSEQRRIWTVVSAAFALRLLLLGVRGDYIVYDEGYYLLLARSIRAGHGFALNGLPHVALSPLQPVVVAALSWLGLDELVASRLLAALCGALLIVPVASLARRWFGERGALTAAVTTALFPSLIAFLPFFPGERWNLYFGSEPLFLLLAFGSIALAARAAQGGHWLVWLAAGALAGLSYDARLEGIVLAAALVVVSAIAALRKGGARALAPASAALVGGLLVAAPYLTYLHHALGRWALSGRVQAAAADEAPTAPPPAAGGQATGGSEAVRAFVWGGDREVLWRTLYALDPSGTRMASQYWGVAPARPAGPAAPTAAPPAAVAPATSARAAATPGAAPPGKLATILRAVAIVVPWWLLLISLGGVAIAERRGDVALWLAPAALTAVIPAVLAYAEPRALLILAPAASVLVGGAIAKAGETMEQRSGGTGTWGRVAVAFAALLGIPTARDLVRSWNSLQPLQQVAGARRAVGEYLGAHLSRDSRIVSWHPAIAYFARREWRVLPYDTFGRIVGYARAQRAELVVLSRFEPSPLRNPPQPFTAVLLDSSSTVTGDAIRLEPVDQTPVLLVGRLAQAP